MFQKVSGNGTLFSLRGEYHAFLSKNCCFAVPKNLVEELFCLLESFWFRTILWIRRWRDYHDFAANCFVSEPKIFVAEPFTLSLFSGFDFFLLKRVK